MRSRVRPDEATASATTGIRISTSLCTMSRRTDGAWAKEITATSRIRDDSSSTASEMMLVPYASEMLLERLVGCVRFAGRAHVLDVFERRLALGRLAPDRFDAHAHAHVFDRTFGKQAEERKIRAVEHHRCADVRNLDCLSVERQVHNTERRHGALARQLDLFPGRDRARRARSARRHVDLAALRTALRKDAPFHHALEETRRRFARSDREIQAARDRHHLDRSRKLAFFGRRSLSAHDAAPSGSKHSMSEIIPTRSGFQRALTRMPVFMRSSLPASTACSSALAHPSRRTSAHANGFFIGCFSRGSRTQDHVVTVPVSATSQRSVSVAQVSGSNSGGGTRIPALLRMPRIRPSLSPARKVPTTVPVERVYGYSSVCVAESTPS